ncbi:hypothetical protein, partial [Bifidobacterium pseudolongum]|uniref:hypothetical protein n=1 Tax=Bifidobacterium pseudolongum TaxID=1694 RepID=UPI001A91017F
QGFQTHIPAGRESHVTDFRTHETPYSARPKTRFQTHFLAYNPFLSSGRPAVAHGERYTHTGSRAFPYGVNHAIHPSEKIIQTILHTHRKG